MKTIYYTTIVDKDVKYNAKQFGEEVDMYLADPDGWESKGYNFVRVQSHTPMKTVKIHLSTPSATHKMGCHMGLSCAELGGYVIRINAMRWVHGAERTHLSLEDYRQYVVSHEMGHILGYDHVYCPAPNQPAPIMMQQTRIGIGKCKPNNKVNI
jgi:Protein of unknown function (DUF3152)